MTAGGRTRVRALVFALVFAAAAGCSGASGSGQARGDTPMPPDAPATVTAPATGQPLAVPDPGRLRDPLLSADVLIYSTRTLRPDVVERIGGIRGVTATEQFAMAQFYYQENPVRYAAVDPGSFRRWTLGATAEAEGVWRRVADGEIAIAPKLGKRIQDQEGYVHIGDAHRSPTVHVGAYAQLFDPRFNDLGIDAVLNQKWAEHLDMVPGNALLVSTGSAAPGPVVERMRKVAGSSASVQVLGFQYDPDAVHTAVLTGESVSSAVGTFNYTANANGTVNIEGSWVSSYIRTVRVPILGEVTCNKVMIPQLVEALTEIRQRGLARWIDPRQYGGCFVPRFIAGTHALSYHAFGLAVDLNVPGNQRGTRGTMNPQVVDIFRRWGFGWGGTWRYTDPMHFQLERVVRAD